MQLNLSRRGFDPQPWNYVRELRSATPARLHNSTQLDLKWCRKQPLEKKCNCQRGGKKCVVRKESNGKILLRNQGTEACKPDDAFDCPDYDFLLDKFVNQD